MSNVNNLTSKIIKDAEERKTSILAKAEEEKVKIVTKKRDEANKVKASMISKMELEAVTKKERILSSAELKVRNEKLLSKGKVIDDVFNKSVDSLCQMKGEDLKSFIKNSIKNLNVDGDETLLLNEIGLKVIDDNFIIELNKELNLNFTMSKEANSFKGGFILEKNGIEINYTFESLVGSLRDEMEFEVANILFN